MRKLVARFRNSYLLLLWWLRLRRRVAGRLKLRGHLDGLAVASDFRCDGDCWLGIYREGGKISIETGVRASGPLIVTSVSSVEIGRDSLFGPNVMITDHYHGDSRREEVYETPPSDRTLHSPGPITIGAQVQLGANTCVLSPAVVGTSVIVGANSVVKGHLSARHVYVGSPARKVISKQRPTSQ